MSRRVLVLDDEPQIRRVLRAYLEADGFGVTEAATGGEALRRVADEPTLVLLDLGLPDGAAWRSCEHCAETRSCPSSW